MPFRTVNELATAQAEDGKFWQSFFYKSTQPATLSGAYGDSSVGAGTPIYNAYVGAQYEFTPLTGAGNRSIYAGPQVPTNKYVTDVQIGTSSSAPPMYCVFADYLGFYALIDGDITDAQDLDNTLSLTRYATGEGVQAFMGMQTPGTAVQVDATMTYTNSDGVAGRSTTFGVRGAVTIGSLANQGTSFNGTQANSAFIRLANGDKGIRSIESITFDGAIGGFVNIVLVKPLFAIQLFEQNTSAEKTFFKESGGLPLILPGAFLQFIALRGTAIAPQPLRGFVNFTWE